MSLYFLYIGDGLRAVSVRHAIRYTHHEKHMKRFVLLFALLAAGASCRAQVVTLDECQQFAQENYPVIAQQELIEKLAEFNVSNARRNWLPQISV